MECLQFENRYGCQLVRTPTHIYLAPHPRLASVVAHYTFCLPYDGSLPPHSSALVLIPDASGCLVFSYTNQGLEGRVYGPTTEVVTVKNDLGTGPLRFFVEFRPGGLKMFTKIPQWELADRIFPLAQVAPLLGQRVGELFDSADDLDEFAAAVDAALVRLLPAPGGLFPLISYVSGGLSSGAELAAYTGYSQRHLARLFREGAGMGLKSFLRVLRVNEAVRRVQAGPQSLTALAQELGYYDQSHFIHDFKSVCGVSPGTYQAGLSDFYNEPLKF